MKVTEMVRLKPVLFWDKYEGKIALASRPSNAGWVKNLLREE